MTNNSKVKLPSATDVLGYRMKSHQHRLMTNVLATKYPRVSFHIEIDLDRGLWLPFIVRKRRSEFLGLILDDFILLTFEFFNAEIFFNFELRCFDFVNDHHRWRGTFRTWREAKINNFVILVFEVTWFGWILPEKWWLEFTIMNIVKNNKILCIL